MDSFSVRSLLQSQRHFHETSGFTSQLRVFGSMVRWLFNCIYPIWRSTYVREKVVLKRSSRGGNAVSRNNFSCEVREYHRVCKNFGGGSCPVCPFLVAALHKDIIFNEILILQWQTKKYAKQIAKFYKLPYVFFRGQCTSKMAKFSESGHERVILATLFATIAWVIQRRF